MVSENGGKAEGAFLTIGELSAELGVPAHILRYWETRFPQLKPLQRSGKRRYYRPQDVVLARRIHDLLNNRGFTIRGAQKALAEDKDDIASAGAHSAPAEPRLEAVPATPSERPGPSAAQLRDLRAKLADALERSYQ